MDGYIIAHVFHVRVMFDPHGYIEEAVRGVRSLQACEGLGALASASSGLATRA